MNVKRLAYKTQHFQYHPAAHVAPDMLKILVVPAITIGKRSTNEQKDQKDLLLLSFSKLLPRTEKKRSMVGFSFTCLFSINQHRAKHETFQ